jgi:DNA-binding transcriptional LysR family regulator
MRPLPFPSERFAWTMYWHRRYEHSRAHEWLREQLVRTASTDSK